MTGLRGYFTNMTVVASRAGSCCRPSALPWRSGRLPRSRRDKDKRKARRKVAPPAARASRPTRSPAPALRADRLEDRAARSLFLPGRRLCRRRPRPTRADELEDPQRRREAGDARHRRLGRTRHSWRLRCAASATCPSRAATTARGASRCGRTGGTRRRPRPRRAGQCLFDGFCWGIEPWDAKKVEAELKKRGLDPVAENHRDDFQSFHVKDPDGFDLQISNGNMKNRRQGAANGKTSAPAPFERTAWKTVWLDHISFQVPNYKETVAFYNALLGWKLGQDTATRISAGLATSATRSSVAVAEAAVAAPAPDAATSAPRAYRSHLVRHSAVRSGRR